MGFWDFLDKEKRALKRLEKNIRRANNKFAPKDYRQAALYEVVECARKGSDVALRGLVTRFAVNAEPSIDDEQEKEQVFDVLVGMDRTSIPALRQALRNAESITWPLRVLREVMSKEEYTGELRALIQDFDTEYERNPDRKIQSIIAISEIQDPEIGAEIVRFLKDVNETVRFQTVGALAALQHEAAREALLETMCQDESIRVRNEVVEVFAKYGWVTTGYKNKVETLLPAGYRHDSSGKIVRLGNN